MTILPVAPARIYDAAGTEPKEQAFWLWKKWLQQTLWEHGINLPRRQPSKGADRGRR
jgi:hypothetical protein